MKQQGAKVAVAAFSQHLLLKFGFVNEILLAPVTGWFRDIRIFWLEICWHLISQNKVCLVFETVSHIKLLV